MMENSIHRRRPRRLLRANLGIKVGAEFLITLEGNRGLNINLPIKRRIT